MCLSSPAGWKSFPPSTRKRCSYPSSVSIGALPRPKDRKGQASSPFLPDHLDAHTAVNLIRPTSYNIAQKMRPFLHSNDRRDIWDILFEGGMEGMVINRVGVHDALPFRSQPFCFSAITQRAKNGDRPADVSAAKALLKAKLMPLAKPPKKTVV